MSFSSLLDDCKFIIFSFLSEKDLLTVSLLNKEYLKLSNNETLWKLFCFRDHKYLPNRISVTWKELYVIQYERNIFERKRARIFKVKHIPQKDRKKVKLDDDEVLVTKKPKFNTDPQFCNFLFKHCNTGKLKRGDVVEYNDFYSIFDGKKFETFGRYNIDNLMIIRLILFEVITEFPIGYWIDIMNKREDVMASYCPFNISYFIDEIMQNMKVMLLDENGVKELNSEIGKLKFTKKFRLFVESSFVYNHYIYFIYMVNPNGNLIKSGPDYEKIREIFQKEDYSNEEFLEILPSDYPKKGRSLFGYNCPSGIDQESDIDQDQISPSSHFFTSSMFFPV